MAPNRFPQSSDTPTTQQFLGQVGGASNVWQASDASLTRPANTTAYVNHNSIGSTTACLFKFTSFFRNKGGSGLLVGARLIANLASIATTNMGAIRMHLFNAPPSSNGGSGLVDQGTFQLLVADEAVKLGVVNFSTWSIGGTGSDTIYSYGTPILSPLPLIGAATAADLYAVLEATGAFTPASAQIIQPSIAATLD